MDQTFVLIGAGQASSQAIDSLRKEGFTGQIVLVGDEPHLPYQRPPLSKKYLAGEMERSRLFIRPATFYETNQVELRLGVRATRLDCAARRVTLDDHSTLNYDRLLLATGSEPRRVNVHGHHLAGIYYLRGIADVDQIRAEMAPGRRVVIVGAGYIGLEVAATCRKLGLEVDVIEMADRVMNRVVAPALSAFFAAEHASHGVRIHTATALASFDGDERVREVVTPDGRRFPADFVIVGVGVLPSDQLAAAAGIACDNGVAVDAHCRTSDLHVYAIGDCASHPSLRYQRRVRLESVDNAFEQAKTAAANMCGKSVLHDKVPWFWSDQYDLKLLIVGLNTAHDQVVLRGDLGTRSFSCCYLRDQELLALDCVNNPKDYMAGRKLIESHARFDLARLADPAVPIKEAAIA